MWIEMPDASLPAHGRHVGEYVAKLGRVWMPKMNAKGEREPWFERLRRLLDALEAGCGVDRLPRRPRRGCLGLSDGSIGFDDFAPCHR